MEQSAASSFYLIKSTPYMADHVTRGTCLAFTDDALELSKIIEN